MSYLHHDRPVTTSELARMRAAGRKIAMLTAYDATFAALCGKASVDVILVGDSLGNVVQGWPSTLPVTLEQMVYHTECVARARSWSATCPSAPISNRGSRRCAARPASWPPARRWSSSRAARI